ncbi:MAG: hypothetical protein HKN39_01890 [Flavobacteriales bacterium]|nr:hypothetical protein [Flavobacteriales bacterium]
MRTKTFHSILFTCILIALYSCQGQVQETPPIESEPKELGKVVTEFDSYIWQVFQDQNDNYWFGSNGNGLFFYNGKELRRFSTDDGLADNSIRGFQADHLGNVFIETPLGVSKYTENSFTSLEVVRSPKNEWKLESTDLWFNCNGMPNDLYRYDGEKLYELKLPNKDLTRAFGQKVYGLSFPGMNPSQYSVFGIDKDSDGNLWIGTITAGAYRYDGKSFLWFPEKELSTLPDGRVPGVRSMLEDKEGYMWLSNWKSKYKIIENDGVLSYEKLEGLASPDDDLPYFNAGLRDRNGVLWMTSYGGRVWKYSENELTLYPVKYGEEDALIISIYEDNSGQLWLGTSNAGVYTFNEGEYERFDPFGN